jgi:hypothetical protein
MGSDASLMADTTQLPHYFLVAYPVFNKIGSYDHIFWE